MREGGQYEIGILYFGGQKENVRNTLMKLLEIDGYRVGMLSVDSLEEMQDIQEMHVELYDFVKNRCEHTVLIMPMETEGNHLLEQALKIGVKLEARREESGGGARMIVIETGAKLAAEYRGRLTCMSAGQDCSGELALEIEEVIQRETRQTGETTRKSGEKTRGAQNIVFAGEISNSKFF